MSATFKKLGESELLPRYIFAESLYARRRVLEIGAVASTLGQSARFLSTRGARIVVAADSDLVAVQEAQSKLSGPNLRFRAPVFDDLDTGSFDLVIVADLATYVRAPELLKDLARLVAKNGYLMGGLRNPAGLSLANVMDPEGIEPPPTYGQLLDALTVYFRSIEVATQSPVLGYQLAFEKGEGLQVDGSLAGTAEAAYYVVLAGHEPVRFFDPTWVQLPPEPLAFTGGKLEDASARARNWQERSDRLKDALNKSRDEVSHREVELKEIRDQLEGSREVVARLTAQIESVTQRPKESRQADELTQKIRRMEAELVVARERAIDAEGRVAAMREEVALHQREQKNATVETLAAQESVRLERSRREQLASELDDTRSRLTQAYEDVRKHQDDAATQRVEAERARLAADRVGEALAAKNRELETSREKELRLADARSESMQAVEALQGELKRAKAAVEAAEESARAREAEKIAAIRSLDLETQKHGALDRELQNAQARLAEVSEDLREQEGNLSAAETELAATKAGNTRLQRDIETLANSERTWREMAQSYEQRLNDTLANVESLSEQVAQLDAEKEQGLARLHRLEGDLTTAVGAERSAREQAQAQVADLQSKLREAEEDREKLLERRDELEGALSDLKKARADDAETLQSQLSYRGALESRIDALTREREAAEARVAELEQKTRDDAAALESGLAHRAALESRIDGLVGQRAEAEQRLTEAGQKLTETGQQLVETEQKLVEAEQKLTEAEQKLTETEQKSAETGQRLAQAEQQLAEGGQKLAETQQSLSETAQQLAKAERAMSERGQTVAQRDAELTGLREQIAGLEAKLQGLQQQLAERDAKILELEQQLAARDEKISERDTKIAAVEQQLSERAAAISGLEQKLAELEQQGSALREKTAADATALESAQTYRQALDARLGQLEADVSDLTDRLAERSAAADRLTEELSVALEKVERTEGDVSERLKTAEAQKAQLTDERDQAKREAARLSGQLDQGRQRVADLAQRSARLETEVSGFKARITELEAQAKDRQERLQETQVKLTHAVKAAADVEKQQQDQLVALKVELEGAQQQAKAEQQLLSGRLATSEAALEDAKRQHIEARRELETVRDSLQATEGARARLEAMLEADRKEAATGKTDLEARLDEARGQIQRLEQRQEVLANESKVLQHELEVQLKRYQELEASAAKAAAEAEAERVAEREKAALRLGEAREAADHALQAAEGAAQQRLSVLTQEIEQYKADRLELEGRLTAAQEHAEHMDAELAEAAEVRAQEAQLREAVESERDALKAELSSARAAAATANEWVVGGKSENEKLAAEMKAAGVDLERTREELLNARKGLEAAQTELGQTREQATALQKTVEEREREKVELADQLAREKAEAQVARQQVDAARAEGSRHGEEAAKLRADAGELQQRLDAQEKAQRDEAQARAAAQQHEVQALHEQLDSVRKEVELAKGATERAQSEARGHQAGKLSLQKELDQLRSELTQAKAAMAETGNEAQAIANTELESVQARAQAAEERAAQAEGARDRVQAELAAAQERQVGLEAEISAARGAASGKGGELEAALAGRRQAEDLLIKMRARYGELDQQLQTELPQLRDQLTELQADNQMLEAERERLAAQVERLETTRTQGADSEKELKHRIDMLQRRVTAQDAELNALRRRAGGVPAAPGAQAAGPAAIGRVALTKMPAAGASPPVKGMPVDASEESPTQSATRPMPRPDLKGMTALAKEPVTRPGCGPATWRPRSRKKTSSSRCSSWSSTRTAKKKSSCCSTKRPRTPGRVRRSPDPSETDGISGPRVVLAAVPVKRPAVFAVTALALAPLAWWAWPSASEPEPEAQPVAQVVAVVPRVTEAPQLEAPVSAKRGTATLRGRVHRHGEPAPGARVQVKGAQQADVHASDAGVFELTGLEPGDYLVWATDARESSAVVGPILVSAESQVDLELLPSASLEGTVVDAHTREPLEGASVVSTAGSTATDHAGRFRFDVLPAGETWIEATAPGHLKRTEWLGLPGAHAHTGLQLALLPSARLEGVVERPGGKPVAQAQVWGEAEISERAGQICGPTTTAADGTFALDCSDGPLQLAASAPQGSRIEGPRVKAEAGKTRTGLHLQLGEELSIEGTVTQAGVPLGGAGLTLYDARSQRPASSGATGPDGRFRIGGVAVGSYLVQISAGARHVQVGPYEQTGEGNEWNIAVPEGGVLAGRVVPAAPGVRVSWRSGDWAGAPATTSTDAGGRFRFEGVPGGELLVEAESPKGVASARARAGQEVVLELTQAHLTVTAVDEKSLPVTDYLLMLEPLSAGSTRRIPVLSSEGKFEGVVGSGRWRVSATAQGFGTSEPQDVELKGPVSIRVTLKTAATLRAIVLDAVTRTPIAGAEVTFKAFVPGRWYAPARQIGPFVSDGRGEVRAAVPDAAVVDVRKGARVLSVPLGRAPRDNVGRVELPLPPEPDAKAPANKAPEVTEYEGVGMQLATEGPRVYVWQTFEGSPAEAAGIQHGDTVVAVDGQPARAPVDQVIPRIMGPSGTAVKLTLQRGAETLDFVVRRRAIRY
ncbi:MAG: carboxypeptidase regulatory-like domain-containing protein [Archangiaceae bacterium]|nr:carboxypeptidase regulatory-like domain-containing protein [Archangiaceae bacterium]